MPLILLFLVLFIIAIVIIGVIVLVMLIAGFALLGLLGYLIYNVGAWFGGLVGKLLDNYFFNEQRLINKEKKAELKQRIREEKLLMKNRTFNGVE